MFVFPALLPSFISNAITLLDSERREIYLSAADKMHDLPECPMWWARDTFIASVIVILTTRKLGKCLGE